MIALLRLDLVLKKAVIQISQHISYNNELKDQ